jgi:Domain of unknown function (DUF4262)
MNDKKQFLELIQSNIDKYEFHVTTVTSMTPPRYAYTIGLSNLLGFELIFAGGIIFLKDDLSLIFDTIVEELKTEKSMTDRNISVPGLGTFSFSLVDSSWSKQMMLGVFDYYKAIDIVAFQIIPDADHRTLDIPNMSNEWNISSEPVWQWLVREWDFRVPENSTVVTNIDAMLGEAITEVMRWEHDAWEMFAGEGPELEKKDMRVVSLGTIIGIDKTLLPAINLDIGKGLWRDSADSDWNNWG